MPSLKSTSKYLSLILRHHPEAAGIRLDEHGWADVQQLIAGVNRTRPLTLALLEEIVRTDEKQRYAFNADKTKIRANQGHSLPVDVELETQIPPDLLYHGTARRFTGRIDAQGLLPQNRLYVHLSLDEETAVRVGRRHGEPAVYQVLAGAMHEAGYTFYRSVNGIWLVQAVPPEYLRRLPDPDR